LKILLRDFNPKWGEGVGDDIFKPTIWNDSLRQDINNNGVKIANFATSKIWLL
jgi:hypothetical protein